MTKEDKEDLRYAQRIVSLNALYYDDKISDDYYNKMIDKLLDL